ncbi:MAG: OmpA family protein [Rhizomicrobium sp.]
MKIRSIALAGAAVLALSVPAAASDATGWYVGLGIGWDTMSKYSEVFTPNTGPAPVVTFKVKPDGTALFIGSFGYRFDSHFRIEDEIGYDSHTTSGGTLISGGPAQLVVGGGTYANGAAVPFKGHSTVESDFVNLVYDIPVSHKWDVSIGAGVGMASVGIKTFDTLNNLYISGAKVGIAYQGIVGVNYSVSDYTDISLDYRYRVFSDDNSYYTPCPGYTAKVKDLNEQALMLSVRFFMSPPPPPPPPPRPPPPVKTYIVFFDFDKSNLTEKAQEVVAEAVKTAKANGFVKVLVVGHTDTVGSDKYNQALSVRRAQAVKDEMVREGLGGDGISIEGKSFHDPLVPTGPGVREPQNRRAVIDLGG